MGERPFVLSRLWPELRRRKVVRAAGIYAVAAVAVIAAASDMFPNLQLPAWTLTFVVVLAVLGFPIALALAWAYNLRPDADAGSGAARAPVSPADVPAAPNLPAPALAGPTAEPASAAPAPSTTEVTPRPGERPAIVVLPFDNLSPDPGQEYFCDGMTEEIITDLSRLRGLHVISRTSAMLLRGSGKDVRTIGRELSVRYVLEGSVRRAGDRLRVTAQLIDSATDAHLWAERYDGEAGDVFAIQESVARSIAQALRVELTPGEEKALSSPPVADATAYDYLLRAHHAIWTGTEASGRAALRYLEAAQEIVGENLAILSALGEAWFMLPHTTGEGMAEIADRMEQIADRILRLDPNCAAGHFNRGLGFGKRRWRAGDTLREFRRASELDPTNASMLLFRGFFAAEIGCTQEGLHATATLQRIDPLSPVARLARGWALLLSGDARDAAREARAGFNVSPESAYFRLFLIAPLIQAGQRDEARRLAAELRRPPDDNWARSILLYDAALNHENLESLLEPALLETARHDETFSLIMAQCFAQASRPGEALDWLENAISLGFTNPEFLGERDILLASLRAEPRFQQLLRQAREIAQAARTEAAPERFVV